MNIGNRKSRRSHQKKESTMGQGTLGEAKTLVLKKDLGRPRMRWDDVDKNKSGRIQSFSVKNKHKCHRQRDDQAI